MIALGFVLVIVSMMIHEARPSTWLPVHVFLIGAGFITVGLTRW